MKNLSYILVSLFLLQCGRAQVSSYTKDIEKKWESPSLFLTPESVKYDADRDILYVANINGDPFARDGNGFISKLGTDGKIIDLHWIDGLDGPKGMGIVGNRLFVTDIDRVVEIDIPASKIMATYPVKDAKFLNDIAVDNSGSVYFTDMLESKIYKLANGTIKLFLQGKEFENCNGLYINDSSLYVGTKNNLLDVNLLTSEVKECVPATGSIDGLVEKKSGEFLFSDWVGSVYRVDTKGGKQIVKLMDTSAEKINAADIEYIPGKNILLVPTFKDNRVMAYSLK